MASPGLSIANSASNALSRPPLCALLIDISGTLLIGTTPTPGAAQSLARLRDAGVPFRFCSNTSQESTAEVCRRMREASMEVLPGEVWTSVGAVNGVLKERDIRRPYMLLSSSARDECVDAGIRALHTNTSNYADDAAPYDAVIVGLAPSLLDYAHLNTAFRILVGEHDGAKRTEPSSVLKPALIALHKAQYIQASDHALSLGPGPFVSALEETAQTCALIVGKPTKLFFEMVIKSFGDEIVGEACGGKGGAQEPERQHIAVIGDDVSADLGEGAIELGLWRVLVKTGKYRQGDEMRRGVRSPDEVCDSFVDFVDRLLDQTLHERTNKKLTWVEG
ncbi:HAD-like domain-containing protein [Scleroderma yunnanense]